MNQNEATQVSRKLYYDTTSQVYSEKKNLVLQAKSRQTHHIYYLKLKWDNMYLNVVKRC